MSLINQVLSDLEERGASTLPGAASVRVVHTQKTRAMAALLLGAALTAVFVMAGLWWSRHNKTVAYDHPSPAMAGSYLSAFGIPFGSVDMGQAPTQQVAADAQEMHKDESRQKGERKISRAAARLSFELSAFPLSSDLRVIPVAAASGQKPKKAVSAAVVSAMQPAPEPLEEGGSGASSAQHNIGEGAPPTLTEAPNDPSSTESKAPVIAPASNAAPASNVDKQIKQVSVQQQAENEFRRASGLMRQGHTDEAIAGYEAALQLDAGHDAARQALVGVLLENKRNADAERVLQDGLKHNPKQSGFAMLLARLQVERNEVALALETLQKALPYANKQADYQAFVAALLQRQGRHNEAIARYQAVLQLSPNSGVWLMGLGMSLQAVRRNEEARDAFKRAMETRTLSAELQAFVAQRLKEL